MGFNGGGRRIGEVAVDCTIAVVHRADEAAWPTLLLSLALEAAAIARLMAVGVAISSAIAIVECRTDLIARILRHALTITIAELLLPAFSGWSCPCLLRRSGLEVLRRLATGCQDLALIACLKVSDELASTILATVLGTLLACILRLVLALAAAAAAALGLPHSVLRVVRGVCRGEVSIALRRRFYFHLNLHL
jgi:hypothetical protein